MNVTLEKLEKYAIAGYENRTWYEESHLSAYRYCRERGFSLPDFLSVVAILSPRVQVSRNIRLAKQWFETRNTDGIMTQRANALRRYHETGGQISGVKINAFRDSLMLVEGSVCIDIHMSRIFGFQNGELMQNTIAWRKRREKAQSIVKRLARRHNVPSYGMQAMLWCGYLATEANRNNGFEPMRF